VTGRAHDANRPQLLPHVIEGSSPLVISLPHVATAIPVDQQHRYTPRALEVEDTDWHLDRLYGFAQSMGATLLVPRWSRYLIDLNRPPQDTPMYPGQNNTELCPTRHFSGESIYREGLAPDEAEVARRLTTYWQPYHDTLQSLLDARRAAYGFAVVFDAHSILSEVPWLFDGILPNFSLGTASGSSCAPALRDQLRDTLGRFPQFSQVVDGRFKGGYTTRHYGQPHAGIHAVQLEMACRTYMLEAAPFAWSEVLAAQARPALEAFVHTLRHFRPDTVPSP
jgi:N-formylglutamate deformylase